ncbi:MAG: hypothetical protein Q9170_005495 [Blastenia crenularia]
MSNPKAKFTGSRGSEASGSNGVVALPIRTKGSAPAAGGDAQGNPLEQAFQYGDDKYANKKQLIYNPRLEVADPIVAAREEKDRPKSGPLVFDKFGDEIKFPGRPGFGTLGIPTNFHTNHFPVTLDAHKTIYCYHVAISEPEITLRPKRRQYFSIIFHQIPEFQSGEVFVATDYAEMFVTNEKLQLDGFDEVTFRPGAKGSLVKISYTEPILPSDVARYLESGIGNSTLPERRLKTTIQALNIIINATPNETPGIYQPSRNTFTEFPPNPDLTNMNAYDSINLGDGLIAVRGYYSSVKTSTARILLNVHGQCSPFYPELNLLDLMKIVCPDRNNLNLLYRLEKFLHKVRIRFNYLKDENGHVIETFRTIHGFSHAAKKDSQGKIISAGNANKDYDTANNISFLSSKHPPSISVADFFFEEHKINVRGSTAPLINFGSETKPIWIPAELGTLLPGQAYKGKLNDGQTTNMLRIAARGPAENARRIVGAGLRVVGIKPDNPTLTAFGVSIDAEMIVVPAQILPPPKLQYGSNDRFTPSNASWNLVGKKFFTPKPLKKWSVLRCGNSRFAPEHLQALRKQIKACGLGDAAPSPLAGYHTDFGTTDDERTDGELRRALTEAKGQKLARIPHTTIVLKTFKQQFESKNCAVNYLADMLQKVNAKNGGINHVLTLQGSPLDFLHTTDTMLVGIDVSHPPAESVAKAPSVVAVVASVDRNYFQYLGNTMIQEGRVEMVSNIGELIAERLDVYGKRNRKYPRNIIIYRDGVSEGQFGKVLKEEISAIESKCAQKYNAKANLPPPKIVVIVCGKRHHTRFYPMRIQDADERHGCNPKNGTLVDRGVTSERFYDFFIQPHAALTGTARPEHCTVIRDDLDIRPDVLHKITHNLSYLYARATKAVSLCPPAYHADILCDRANKYLHKHLNQRWPAGAEFEFNNSPWLRGVHPDLQDRMFYI